MQQGDLLSRKRLASTVNMISLHLHGHKIVCIDHPMDAKLSKWQAK